jgi:calcineurin-like phosphoesterase family protein
VEVYFTADLHFGHARIVELADRPFASVQEMDEALIANWNAVVRRPDDLVWVLGDYALGDRRQGLGHLQRLNGRKMLVAGNHDKCFLGSSDGWKHIGEYRAAGFEVVVPWARVKLPPPGPELPGRKVLLSHFPYDGDSTDEDRHSGARLRDEGEPLVHGHVHEKFTMRRSAATGAVQLNVGVDRWQYRPVPATEVARMIAEAEAEAT